MVPLPRYLTALETLLDATRQAGLDTEAGSMLIQHAVQAIVAMVEDEPEPKLAEQSDPSADCLARYEFLSELPESTYPTSERPPRNSPRPTHTTTTPRGWR